MTQWEKSTSSAAKNFFFGAEVVEPTHPATFSCAKESQYKSRKFVLTGQWSAWMVA